MIDEPVPIKIYKLGGRETQIVYLFFRAGGRIYVCHVFCPDIFDGDAIWSRDKIEGRGFDAIAAISFKKDKAIQPDDTAAGEKEYAGIDLLIMVVGEAVESGAPTFHERKKAILRAAEVIGDTRIIELEAKGGKAGNKRCVRRIALKGGVLRAGGTLQEPFNLVYHRFCAGELMT